MQKKKIMVIMKIRNWISEFGWIVWWNNFLTEMYKGEMRSVFMTQNSFRKCMLHTNLAISLIVFPIQAWENNLKFDPTSYNT
ncbi:unnamed protein product [Blepharisma stoltei]|uniref:Uncharacterized protein n=1 Tax=Blepharisma stoltei TaxID=1481888 RepID=A0AAU9J0P0_9CILI|nr:unnamed protein product [Blepharisma stoltei]